MKIGLIVAAGILSVLQAAACGQSPTSKVTGDTKPNGHTASPFRVEQIASGLEVPWSIVFAPDSRLFFTERPGRVRTIEHGTLRAQPLATIADVEPAGESGLLGMTLDPRFAENHWLYLAYTYRSDRQYVRVVRFREVNNTLTDARLIIDNIPAASIHAGCRLRFGPDGKLYITTGDAAERELAQRLDSLAGKTLRLNDDGTVPADNPFVNRKDARPEIWSYGHRNAQGLDWQPGTNLLFQTEHGPGGGDELNIVERGENYGWPVIDGNESRDQMRSPLLEYTPSVAPSSGMFYRGNLFPQFQGNFFFGGLRGRCLMRVILDGRRVVSQERLLGAEYGRLREVAEAADGSIYVTTANRDGRGSPAREDDRILRLVPPR